MDETRVNRASSYVNVTKLSSLVLHMFIVPVSKKKNSLANYLEYV